jgi:hypothetical protein
MRLAVALGPATTALAMGGRVAAFPGAEGFGATATAGRGGRVLFVDRRIVRQVSEGTGRIIDAPGDVGGYPSCRAQDLLSDVDQDGMPDAWENARKLDPRRPDANGHDLDPRYDNIEVYINSLFDAAPGARDPR